MNIDITSDVAQLTELMRRKAQEAPVVIQKAVVDSTQIVLVESRDALSQEIYNQPIPKRKNGKDAWKRTSNLIQQERAHFPGRFEGVVDNRAPYANARHELNKPSPVDGKVRRAPWRRSAVIKAEPKVKNTMEQAIKVLTD